MNDSIKWGAPPPDPRGNGIGGSKWPGVFESLRSRPGEWARVHTGAASTANSIKGGRLKGCVEGEFEAVVRAIGPGKWDIYARFVGGES